MNGVAVLPSRPLGLSPAPAAMLGRRFEVLATTEGFEDRVQWAAEMLIDLRTLRVAGLLSGEQLVGVLRQLRSVLQADLGAVTMDDGGRDYTQVYP